MKTLTPEQKFLLTETTKHHIALLENYDGPEKDNAERTKEHWVGILQKLGEGDEG